MRKTAMWCWLLTKRLYKKVTFVCILLLIPLLIVLFSQISKEESGMLTIVLSCEQTDPFAMQIVEEFMQDDSVILFQYEPENSAYEKVQGGKADAAWIFPGNLEERLIRFSENNGGEGIVKIVERESTVPLRLAREMLSSVLYTHCSEYVYLRYLRECVPETTNVSEEELLKYLQSPDVTGELFAFYDIEGNRQEEKVNYLTSPIRGILATIVAITALVTAMYYQQDYDRGMFSLLPERKRLASEFGYQLIAISNVMTAVFLALFITGMLRNMLVEVFLAFIYCLCCCAFGMVMRGIFGGKRWLGALLPAFLVLMLTVCPVFFNISSLYLLQLLLPPSYYIQGIYNTQYLICAVCYIIIMFAISLLVDYFKRTPFANYFIRGK